MKDKLIEAANALPDDVQAAVLVTRDAKGELRVVTPDGALKALNLFGLATAMISVKMAQPPAS
jgi:hypothetical protein